VSPCGLGNETARIVMQFVRSGNGDADEEPDTALGDIEKDVKDA
jgi:hypothetical protein